MGAVGDVVEDGCGEFAAAGVPQDVDLDAAEWEWEGGDRPGFELVAGAVVVEVRGESDGVALVCVGI